MKLSSIGIEDIMLICAIMFSLVLVVSCTSQMPDSSKRADTVDAIVVPEPLPPTPVDLDEPVTPVSVPSQPVAAPIAPVAVPQSPDDFEDAPLSVSKL